MIKEDYIMRIIHEAVRMLLKLLFQIEEEREEEITFASIEMETYYRKLRKLAEEGRINEAENRLSELLDGKNQEAFQMALLFYDYLNTFSDEKLEQADYSREEIQEGVLEAAKTYGYDGMVAALLEKI